MWRAHGAGNDPVGETKLSPRTVPGRNAMANGYSAVFPDVHTPYDYDEGF